MKRLLGGLALFAAAHAVQGAGTIDFASTEGLRRTCAPLLKADPRKLASDRERVAYAICKGVATAQDAATWFHRNPAVLNAADKAGVERTRAKLEEYLATIAQIRGVLERVDAAGELFVIEPGKWQIDFDGDGRISFAERHFFWVARRGANVEPFTPVATEERLRAAYVSPVIRVDQADVYWAVAYCNFAEATLNVVLAYDVGAAAGGATSVVLAHPERIRNAAYRRVNEGIRYSIKLREALLRETDDDREWIANPRQHDTSFPLAMDAQTFETWGRLLMEVQRMLQGKALLGGSIQTGGPRGLVNVAWNLCRDGEGVDLKDLFMHPLERPLEPNALSRRCAKATAAKPLSGLAALASASIARNAGRSPEAVAGEWMVLRYLYWVN